MLKIAEKALFGIDWFLSRIAALTILVVMVLIVCDVFGRYTFSRPLPWVYDIVSIYVVNLVLYYMAAEVLRTRSHIELDLSVRLLPKRAWSALQGVAWLAVAVALGLAAWRAGLSMTESFASREVHPGLYEWPVWVEKAIVALGLALLVCRILVRGCRFVQQGFDGEVFNADESDDPVASK